MAKEETEEKKVTAAEGKSPANATEKGHVDPPQREIPDEVDDREKNLVPFKAKYMGEFDGRYHFEFDYMDQEDVKGSIPVESLPDFKRTPKDSVETIKLPNPVLTEMLINTDAHKNAEFPEVREDDQEQNEA